MPQRYPPDSPREWLNRAHSNLALAKMEEEDVYLEDLCFNAQQAVEKSIKALLMKHGVGFPHTHDIAELLTLVQGVGQQVPESVKQAAGLTRFAVLARYPSIAPPISRAEYQEVVVLAEQVVCWVADIIKNPKG